MAVNGVELKEGQVWATTNGGLVTLEYRGSAYEYPWKCLNEEGFWFSVTDTGLSVVNDPSSCPLKSLYSEPETPQEAEVVPKKYTIDEICEILDKYDWSSESVSDIRSDLENYEQKNTPEYQEYLRLKAIYEPKDKE